MKTIRLNLLTAICCLSVFASCSSGSSSNERKLTGTYVSQGNSAFSIAYDTLMISSLNMESGTFMIDRRTGYHPIRQGKLLPKVYKSEKWIGIWDAKLQVLAEGEYGRQIRLVPDRAGILLKTIPYLRIKPNR